MGKITQSRRFGGGYKKRYEIYGHYKDSGKMYSEYVFDWCLVYAREQFKAKYPNIVIDIARIA